MLIVMNPYLEQLHWSHQHTLELYSTVHCLNFIFVHLFHYMIDGMSNMETLIIVPFGAAWCVSALFAYAV